jgi:hypothetical protein
MADGPLVPGTVFGFGTAAALSSFVPVMSRDDAPAATG